YRNVTGVQTCALPICSNPGRRIVGPIRKHFRTPPPGRTKPTGGIPLLRGMKMEIGCGARVRNFDGRLYFYFWHYDRDDGRSQKRSEERRVGKGGSGEV